MTVPNVGERSGQFFLTEEGIAAPTGDMPSDDSKSSREVLDSGTDEFPKSPIPKPLELKRRQSRRPMAPANRCGQDVASTSSFNWCKRRDCVTSLPWCFGHRASSLAVVTGFGQDKTSRRRRFGHESTSCHCRRKCSILLQLLLTVEL